jgi:hypothetical protein
MSRLVRLYPRAWRDRYEAEFLALVEERPLTLGDVVDTVRGAVDAHVHQQLGGDVPQPWTHRIPGLLALTGGLTYTVAIALLALSGDPDRDWGSLVAAAFLLMFFSLPGDYMADHGRRIAAALALVGGCVVVVNLVPWEVASLLGVIVVLTVVGGMLTLAAIRAGIGAARRWLVLAISVGLPAAVMIPVLVGLVSVDVSPAQALILSYGLAWILIGFRMVVRGSPTIVDLPKNPIATEVRAA